MSPAYSACEYEIMEHLVWLCAYIEKLYPSTQVARMDEVEDSA